MPSSRRSALLKSKKIDFVSSALAHGNRSRSHRHRAHSWSPDDLWRTYIHSGDRDASDPREGAPKEAATLFPRIHRVFTHLTTWVWGTHRGVSKKHLPHYLNEFVFRFNRRRTPMAAFQSLLGLTGQHRTTACRNSFQTVTRPGTCSVLGPTMNPRSARSPWRTDKGRLCRLRSDRVLPLLDGYTKLMR